MTDQPKNKIEPWEGWWENGILTRYKHLYLSFPCPTLKTVSQKMCAYDQFNEAFSFNSAWVVWRLLWNSTRSYPVDIQLSMQYPFLFLCWFMRYLLWPAFKSALFYSPEKSPNEKECLIFQYCWPLPYRPQSFEKTFSVFPQSFSPKSYA